MRTPPHGKQRRQCRKNIQRWKVSAEFCPANAFAACQSGNAKFWGNEQIIVAMKG
jgi:hypothetical protein